MRSGISWNEALQIKVIAPLSPNARRPVVTSVPARELGVRKPRGLLHNPLARRIQGAHGGPEKGGAPLPPSRRLRQRPPVVSTALRCRKTAGSAHTNWNHWNGHLPGGRWAALLLDARAKCAARPSPQLRCKADCPTTPGNPMTVAQ